MNDPVGMHPGASAKQTPGASAKQNPGASAKQNLGASAKQNLGASAMQNDTKHTLPQRKNIRAEFHDYSGGDYFITICTRNKEHYFGKIINGEMIYTPIGLEAERCMATLASHYAYVEVPLFVIMPNHVHAIIRIRENADAPGCIPTIRTALGVVVGGYKQAVTRYARRNNIEFGWQSRYHDHIIRDNSDGNRIAEYIENNVARWANDCFCV
ncbi:MAG: transposase [Muribaculaceae bacterium]|nr:transposase [Muribaculaceae bacterium]